MADVEEVVVSEEDKKKYKILRNAYMKLDNLPLSFGMPAYDDDLPDNVIEKYFRTDLADTLRETRIAIEDIEENSVDEMQFENRIVYHALRRFRLSATAFFKFSTAVAGKTVDKTTIIFITHDEDVILDDFNIIKIENGTLLKKRGVKKDI